MRYIKKGDKMNEHYLEVVQSYFNKTGATIFGNKKFIKEVPVPSGRYIFGVIDAFNYMRLYISVDFVKETVRFITLSRKTAMGVGRSCLLTFTAKKNLKKERKK